MAWVIRYHNLSSHDVSITNFGGTLEDVVSEVNHQPSSSLATGERDYLSIDQNSPKFIGSGAVDFYQGIGDPPGSMLWVRIHVPFQMLGIGTGPYWYYMINEGRNPTLEDSGWQRHESETVKTQFASFKVVLSPVVSHTEIELSVILEDER